MTAKEALKSIFGYDDFRGDQEAVIHRTLEGNHSLLLMPTGMGKSLCYQIPSRLQEGLTLVISPLIALMKDQVDDALKKGFRCAFINSSLKKHEREDRYKKLAKGEYELLYVTPERFRKEEFLEALGKNKISLLAIDEAHCISQWGHDFRPDYTRIKEFREKMGNPKTLSLTATATPEVQKDIVAQCGLSEEEVQVFHSGLERPNLSLAMEDVVGMDEKVRLFLAHSHQNQGPCIVYFSLIETLQKFSYEIKRLGLKHWQYHGRMSPQQRRETQEKFIRSKDGLILATPAFGLGVNKENVRSVVHAEMPGSVEAYYQEVGRAGRDGEPASCLLMYDEDDVSIQMDFIKWANPDPGYISTVYRLLKENPDKFKAEGLDYLRGQLNFYHSRDFRLETALNHLERWDCIEGDIGRREVHLLSEPPSEFLEDQHYEARLKSQQKKLLDMVQLVKNSDCRKQRIYEYFGFAQDEACGQCDVCWSQDESSQ